MVYIEVLKLDIYYMIIQKTIYKLELKKEYINIYNIYITKIKIVIIIIIVIVIIIIIINHKKKKKDTS